ncbi:phosphatase PAP2 family protein [Pedobacter alluvionis]|uniref:Membrane-associated phospholipid phosphatase n=1 Tax=Pedobacter alluvionis TaxID=475253 RepID=A0A497YD78_9SPHI|nr:phosphatase PAP2 family protein [Pedobacter alluvionis]RLJ80427.1 membrane-associated phospholipid phosphatase [Pedobacter alluvionis]TFB31694.1 phosphatase PAP2 family protein [Pedobacter alluvionis]
MRTIKRLTKLHYYFFTAISILLLALIFNFSFSKTDGFLIFNRFHTAWLDIFLKYITNLGDGLISILVATVLLAIRKKKKAMTVALAYIYSGLLIQIAKRIFHMPRPKYYFEQTLFQYNHFVEGVSMYNHNSFPSGHTASAFALTTVLVLVFKKKKISPYCLFFAFLIGYSRIYLAQHFLIDVIFGAITGITCAILSYHQVYDLKLFRSAKLNRRYKQLKITNQVNPI